MHPSSTISFEPGLDRGVPWGRDLITFMTSAAGYMMRTLQKPRKNKPSKRQVNHRRFLHNMIQRKFADIEAANQQLASALFTVDAEPQRQSEVKSTTKQESEKHPKKATEVFGVAETKQLQEDYDTRIQDSIVINRNGCSLTNKTLNLQHNVKICHMREDEDLVENSDENSAQEIIDFIGEREQTTHCAAVDSNDLTSVSDLYILEDSVFTSPQNTDRLPDSLHVQIPTLPDGEQYLGLTLFEPSPTSPVSLLSLNSYDFEVKIQPDNDNTSQIQHTAESLQMDLMENLELLDSEEYLQQIDQMDMAAVWDVHTEDDLSCFQHNLPILNASHTDFAMNKKAFGGDGDICGGLQHISTLLQNAAKNTSVENELRSNIVCSLAQSGHHNHVRQTGRTVDCSLTQTEISTAVNKEDQYLTGGIWTISEQGTHSCQLEHDLLNHTEPKIWEQQLKHYNHAASEEKYPYYTLTDQELKIIESGPILNLNSDYSNSLNALLTTSVQCYGFDIPVQATIGDSCSFSNKESNQSIPSFEGVAQSFPAPYQNTYPYPVSTPPLNDDWLFSNIATEVDFDSMVRSHSRTYC